MIHVLFEVRTVWEIDQRQQLYSPWVVGVAEIDYLEPEVAAAIEEGTLDEPWLDDAADDFQPRLPEGWGWLDDDEPQYYHEIRNIKIKQSGRTTA